MFENPVEIVLTPNFPPADLDTVPPREVFDYHPDDVTAWLTARGCISPAGVGFRYWEVFGGNTVLLVNCGTRVELAKHPLHCESCFNLGLLLSKSIGTAEDDDEDDDDDDDDDDGDLEENFNRVEAEPVNARL